MNPVRQKSQDGSYLRLISDINRKIGASSDVDEVLGYILDALREIIPFESAALFLVHPKTLGLKYAVHRGAGASDGKQFPSEHVRLAQEQPAGYYLEFRATGPQSSRFQLSM